MGDSRLDDQLSQDGQTVRDGLLGKHPVGQGLHRECIDQSAPPSLPTHPVIFEAIDAHLTALCTTGSAGPSGLDARDWRRLSKRSQGIYAIN